MTDAARPLVPPLLYVPVRDYEAESTDVLIDFRRMPDGRTALIAFTALDRLVAGCGADQPWILLPTDRLAEVDKHSPYDVILLDVEITPETTGGCRMSGFQADPGLINRLKATLQSGADSLNDVADSVPGVPDAGAVSGEMAAILAKQVDAAGEIAVGVGAAGDAVAADGAAYEQTDDAARRSLLPHMR